MTGSFSLLSEDDDVAHYSDLADAGDDLRHAQKVEER